MNTLTPGEALRKRSGLLKQLNEMLESREAEDCLNALGRFLRKEVNPWKRSTREERWSYVGQETVDGKDPFVAKDCFVVDESPAALVKIGYMNTAFREQFLPIIDEGAGKCPFVAWRNEVEDRISAHHGLIDAGGRRCARLAHIWELLRKQRDNKEQEGRGILDSTCHQNVFYAYGKDGNIWVVVLLWGHRKNENNDGGDYFSTGWGVYAFPLQQKLFKWDRILSVVAG